LYQAPLGEFPADVALDAQVFRVRSERGHCC
jgi:hypothetical protein